MIPLIPGAANFNKEAAHDSAAGVADSIAWARVRQAIVPSLYARAALAS